jgi:hypothetical protein
MRIPILRPRRAATLAALALGAAAVPVAAHEGDQRYRSVVTAVTPATRGLQAQVLDYDDRLQLVNHSGRTVMIAGYAGAPYARVLADGTVQVNQRSAGVTLNEDEGQALAVTAVKDKPGPPAWKTLDRTGTIEWHDHRIHYRASAVPPQVRDRSKRTLVDRWRVPIVVGGRPGTIAGTLTWVGTGGSSSFPVAAVVSLAMLVVLALGAVALVQRRRRAGEGRP